MVSGALLTDNCRVYELYLTHSHAASDHGPCSDCGKEQVGGDLLATVTGSLVQIILLLQIPCRIIFGLIVLISSLNVTIVFFVKFQLQFDRLHYLSVPKFLFRLSCMSLSATIKELTASSCRAIATFLNVCVSQGSTATFSRGGKILYLFYR